MDIAAGPPSTMPDHISIAHTMLASGVEAAWVIGEKMKQYVDVGVSADDAIDAILHPFRRYSLRDMGGRVIEVRYLGGGKTTDGYRVWRVRY
ncbi:MAG: hypothetical protein IPK26_10645 [Planctomycetes bacterium]|nr:hypothetical protein [Planctomycetota bacterium]